MSLVRTQYIKIFIHSRPNNNFKFLTNWSQWLNFLRWTGEQLRDRKTSNCQYNGCLWCLTSSHIFRLLIFFSYLQISKTFLKSLFTKYYEQQYCLSHLLTDKPIIHTSLYVVVMLEHNCKIQDGTTSNLQCNSTINLKIALHLKNYTMVSSKLLLSITFLWIL